jgi:hypothetical protein
MTNLRYVCVGGLVFAGALAAADNVCGTGTLLDVQASTRIRQGQEVTTSSVRERDHGREEVYQSVATPSEQKVTEYTIAARLDGIVYTAQSRDFFWRTKPTGFVIGDPIQVCVTKGKLSLTGPDGRQYKGTVVRAAREEIIALPGLEAARETAAATTESASDDAAPSFSSDALDQLVSRIALYPDPLLAQILAAATYPDQIPEAAAWADLHSSHKSDALARCIKDDHLPWDSSVQALLPFPSVLVMMGRDLNWTRRLGNATLAQREDVMDAVQRMRQKAKDFGYLQSNQQVTVTAPAPNVIEIEPANPVVVSVPVYDPDVVFVRRPFDERVSIWIGPSVAIGPAFTFWGWEGSGFVWSTHRFRLGHRDWDDDWRRRHHDHYGDHDRRTNFLPRREPERKPQRREIHNMRPTGRNERPRPNVRVPAKQK